MLVDRKIIMKLLKLQFIKVKVLRVRIRLKKEGVADKKIKF